MGRIAYPSFLSRKTTAPSSDCPAICSPQCNHLPIRHPATRVFGREPSVSMESPNSSSTNLQEFPKNISMIIGPSSLTWDGNPNQLLVPLNFLVSRQLWLLQSSCFLVTAHPKRIVVQPQFGVPGWWLTSQKNGCLLHESEKIPIESDFNQVSDLSILWS